MIQLCCPSFFWLCMPSQSSPYPHLHIFFLTSNQAISTGKSEITPLQDYLSFSKGIIKSFQSLKKKKKVSLIVDFHVLKSQWGRDLGTTVLNSPYQEGSHPTIHKASSSKINEKEPISMRSLGTRFFFLFAQVWSCFGNGFALMKLSDHWFINQKAIY